MDREEVETVIVQIEEQQFRSADRGAHKSYKSYLAFQRQLEYTISEMHYGLERGGHPASWWWRIGQEEPLPQGEEPSMPVEIAAADLSATAASLRRVLQLWSEKRERSKAASIDQVVRELLPSLLGSDPPPGREKRLSLDLEYILERLLLVFPMGQASIWLESYNPAINGRPIDVLALRGLSQVLHAVDIEEQNAY